MSGSRWLASSVCGSFLLLAVAQGWGGQAHDIRGWNPQTDANDVIDKKCKSCHARDRVEAAVAKKADMSQIVRRMEAKGVKLDAKEKEVLGIFATSPFKKQLP